jgi:DNA polymerase-1
MKLIVDGNYTLYRAIYSSGDLSSSTGEPTGGIFKFLKMLRKYTKLVPSIKDVVVVFDGGRASFRKELYPEYKKKLTPSTTLTEEELKKKRDHDFINKFSFSEVQSLLPQMGITTVIVPGEEADDVIFRLAQHYLSKGERTLVLSDDEDYMQFIAIGAEVYRAMKDVHVTKDNYRELMGHDPDKFVLYKALVGDGSDNINGVSGIGGTTANKIVNELPTASIEDLLKFASTPGPKYKEKLRNNIDIVERNLKLINIDLCHLTLGTCLAALETESENTIVDLDHIFEQFKRFEFSSLTGWISELSNYAKTPSKPL